MRHTLYTLYTLLFIQVTNQTLTLHDANCNLNCVSRNRIKFFVIARAMCVSCGYLSMLSIAPRLPLGTGGTQRYLAIYFSNVIRFICISNYVYVNSINIYILCVYYVLLLKLCNIIIISSSFFCMRIYMCLYLCFVSRILSNKYL